MILVINIGNSNLNFALFNNNVNFLYKSWIIKTKPIYILDQYIFIINNIYKKHKINHKIIKKIILGSVVPFLTKIISDSLYKIHNIIPIILDIYIKSPVKHNSNELGIDLYANAIAAYILYRKTCLIIDFGTALTLTCVSKKGIIIGVVIIPGIRTSLNALIKNTCQLKYINFKKTKNILGLKSENCIQSGITYGYLNMIEGLIFNIKKEINEKCCIISTGGMCDFYSSLTNEINFSDKFHTLKGLVILYQIKYLKMYNK